MARVNSCALPHTFSSRKSFMPVFTCRKPKKMASRRGDLSATRHHATAYDDGGVNSSRVEKILRSSSTLFRPVRGGARIRLPDLHLGDRDRRASVMPRKSSR